MNAGILEISTVSQNEIETNALNASVLGKKRWKRGNCKYCENV